MNKIMIKLSRRAKTNSNYDKFNNFFDWKVKMILIKIKRE